MIVSVDKVIELPIIVNFSDGESIQGIPCQFSYH